MGAKAAQQPGPQQWDGIVRRSFDVTIRGVNPEERSVEVIASTTSVDGHGDILEQDWRLERYRKNPVVLWHHNRFESSPWSMGEGIRPEDLLPIGHAENVRIENGCLCAKLLFGSAEYNQMSERVFLGFKEGHIRAVSVGFRPGKITEEKVDGGTLYRLSQNDLYEISAVPIPSNPDAVAKHIAFERSHLGRMAAETNEETTTMAMTNEEKAALEAAQSEARTMKTRVTALESDLAAEKAVTGKLTTELKTASERASKAEDVSREAEIDALVGKKITPAEKDEYLKLAKDIGTDRVKAIVAQRPDLKLVDPVKVDGKGVGDDQTAPPPSEGAGGASEDISKAAMDAVHKA
jgi:hypothetical protein